MYCAVGANDVMFAHYAVRRNIIYAVNIIAVGNITCPRGQTSFGGPSLSKVAAPKRLVLYSAAEISFVKHLAERIKKRLPEVFARKGNGNENYYTRNRTENTENESAD